MNYNWFPLKAVQTFEFGGVNKHITFSRFLQYEGVIIQLHRAGGSGPTTPTLVGPKILTSAVKVLHFQNFGWSDNCLVEAFLKWSDHSRTPSAAPVTVQSSV